MSGVRGLCWLSQKRAIPLSHDFPAYADAPTEDDGTQSRKQQSHDFDHRRLPLKSCWLLKQVKHLSACCDVMAVTESRIAAGGVINRTVRLVWSGQSVIARRRTLQKGMVPYFGRS